MCEHYKVARTFKIHSDNYNAYDGNEVSQRYCIAIPLPDSAVMHMRVSLQMSGEFGSGAQSVQMLL